MTKLYSLQNMKRLSLLVFAFCLVQFQAIAQINITPSSAAAPITAQQLAQVLVGQGVVVSNAQLSGGYAHEAVGIFGNGLSTNIGLDSGIVLSTGYVADINNPASVHSGSETSGWGNVNPGGANQYLEELIPPAQSTNDAIMLEFDVQVASDTLRFEYVFASEEYPDFSCSSYNDVFGFFISGPGVVGNMGAAFPGVRNIALLPDGVTPVTINNVHGATGPTCPAANAQYFVENYSGISIIYNGFTTVLKAEIWGLTPCETYHLRLAIADVGDTGYDSGVFIKQGSLNSQGVIFSGHTEVSYAGFDDLMEGCVNGGFVIKRTGDITQSKTVSFSIGGTAINGWDYTGPAPDYLAIDSIYTFAPGQDSLFVEIWPYDDGVSDNNETIIIDLKSTCTDSATGEQAILIIRDEIPLELSTNPVVNGPVCEGVPIQLSATGAIDYQWGNIAPGGTLNDLSNDLIANPVLTPTTNGTYVVLGFVSTCAPAIDTLDIVIEPAPIDPAGPDLSSCNTGAVQLQGSGGGTYTWTGPNAFASNLQTPTTTYANAGTYTLDVVTPAGCAYTDYVQVSTLGPVFTLGADQSICPGGSVPLQTTITANGTGPLTYSFAPATGLSNPAIGNPVASPTTTTTYILSVTNGANCTSYDTITINVNEVPDIDAGPNQAICEGVPFTLQATDNSTATGITYTWSNASMLSSPYVLNPAVTTTTGGTFVLAAYNGNCVAYDSVTLTVNPLPVLAVGADTTICAGEAVLLTASVTNNLPGVQYTWSPAGSLSGANTANPVATPTVTTTYSVIASSNTCSDSAAVTVTVNPIPQITAGADTSICEGTTITLQGADNTGVGGINYAWLPANEVSDAGILTPTATPTGTTQYTLTATLGNCPSADVVTVTVNPYPVLSAGPGPENCPLQASILPVTDVNNVPGVTYSWTPATGLSATNILNPIAAPASTTTYTAIATANGCESEPVYVTVTTKDAPVVDAGPDQILCPNVPFVRLEGTETSGLAGMSYQWSPDGTASTATEISTDVSPSATTTYYLTATANGCSHTDSALVTVGSGMDLQIIPSPAGGLAPLSVTFAATGNNIVSYAWNFGDTGSTTDTSSLTNPTYLYTQQGLYLPTLIAQDNLGCIDSVAYDNIRVSVGVPNIFTPNGDGVNDVFDLGSLPANTIVRVFNRWGNIVYESTNYQNNWGAEGTADGVYFYSVSYPDNGDDFKGWLEIHR